MRTFNLENYATTNHTMPATVGINNARYENFLVSPSTEFRLSMHASMTHPVISEMLAKISQIINVSPIAVKIISQEMHLLLGLHSLRISTEDGYLALGFDENNPDILEQGYGFFATDLDIDEDHISDLKAILSDYAIRYAVSTGYDQEVDDYIYKQLF